MKFIFVKNRARGPAWGISFAAALLACGITLVLSPVPNGSLFACTQDDLVPVSNLSIETRIVRLQEELAKQLRVLGSRHPDVLNLRAELQILKRYVGEPADDILAKIIELEIELAKSELEFSGNHPKIKSLRKQIYRWRIFSKQERIGSEELFRLDMQLEALRINLIALQDSNLAAGHPDFKKVRKEMQRLQQERNILGLQEECERQGLYIWASEIDRLISSEAKKQGLSSAEWMQQKTRDFGQSEEEFRTNTVWKHLALQKLANSKTPLKDKQLQAVISHFRRVQQ
ncbi:MAG: hypothetical protein MK106_03245 [Mariniblastus sp.]|nr:hypothetical protein [Mariniblastus sp.]